MPHGGLLGQLPCTKLVLISENYLMQAHFNISLKLNIIRKINQLLKKKKKSDEDTQMIFRTSCWSGLLAWCSER